MKTTLLTLSLLALLTSHAWGQGATETALSCADFKPTAEALDRFPDLIGACEAVVERNGQLFGKFKAVVRRARANSTTLYLPATDHTFTVETDADMRVLMGGRKVRPRDLSRGEEIRIYLSTQAFATPNIEEIVLVTETDAVMSHPVTATAALPTTASLWPALGLASLLLLASGALIRRVRLARGNPA